MTKNLTDELQATARAALTGLQPTPMGEEPGGLSIRKLLAAAFRGRYLLFGTTLFGVLIGTFLAITTANTYQSTGTFQFSSSGAEISTFDPTRAAQTSQETIATSASYILNSDELLQKVVARLGAAHILQPYQPGGGPEDSGAKALFFRIQRDWNATRAEDRTPDEALKHLKRTVFVERPRFTDVLIATCKSNSARLAQEILAAYMDEAIKLHIAKYDDERAYDEAHKTFTDAQTKQEAERSALREFLEREAMVDDFDAEKRRLQLEAADASVQFRKYEDEVRIKQSQIAERSKLLEGPEALKPYMVVKEKPGLRPEDFTGLTNNLHKAELELARLEKAIANPNDDVLAAKRGEVEFWKGKIESQRSAARTAEPVEMEVPNPLYRANLDEKAKLGNELITAEAMLESAKHQQEKRSVALKALLALEPQYESLRAASKFADGNVEATRITWEAAQRKRTLGLGNYSTLKEIQPATMPLEKEGPNRGKLLLGGFFVGLFLGLGIVVLRAMPDTVIRTRDDLEHIDGLAVIGLMPRLDAGNLRRHVALREQGW